ncbi:hypothetical protein Pelo_18307 [Pelomyxa schiedti]|nr:hypothetical protein Pelo_18307 [Pelomyxa schiedti]
MDVVVGGNYLASNPAIVGGLWWFENPGFVQHTVSSPERDLRGLAVGNITKTGKLGDFAAGLQNSTAGPLRYFHSNCDSTSECWSPTSVSALAPATEVYTVDIDGDGWLDVVQMGFSLTGAYWHKNPGHSGTWVTYPIIPITGYRFAAWADFNHDSTTDMASGAVNTVQWFSNYNGDGSGWHNFSIANVSGVKDIKAADISGDGWADVIVCGSTELVYLTNPHVTDPLSQYSLPLNFQVRFYITLSFTITIYFTLHFAIELHITITIAITIAITISITVHVPIHIPFPLPLTFTLSICVTIHFRIAFFISIQFQVSLHITFSEPQHKRKYKYQHINKPP